MKFFNNINKIFIVLRSLPKSIYASFRLFPVKDAIKMPIFIHYNCKIIGLNGSIFYVGSGNVKSRLIRIGFIDSSLVYDRKSFGCSLKIMGNMHIMGNLNFGPGCNLFVEKDASLEIGNNVTFTAESTIICMKHIQIGNDVAIAWNTLISDTDFHSVYNINEKRSYPISQDIFIGDNVWLCTRSIILKGSIISSGCIVGANSTINKKFDTPNCLIAGNPAKIIKEGVCFERPLYI